jgi:hypothetical protein
MQALIHAITMKYYFANYINCHTSQGIEISTVTDYEKYLLILI